MPQSAVTELEARKQHVLQSRDEVGGGASDELVARRANDLHACILTNNAKHFKRLVSPSNRKWRFASCILLECDQPMITRRLESLMDLVLFEFSQSPQRSDGRVFLTIKNDRVIVQR